MKKFLSKLLFRDAPGKLADDLPRPVDPVSGKPMEYFYGDTEITREVFQSGKNQLDKKRCYCPRTQIDVPGDKAPR